MAENLRKAFPGPRKNLFQIFLMTPHPKKRKSTEFGQNKPDLAENKTAESYGLPPPFNNDQGGKELRSQA